MRIHRLTDHRIHKWRCGFLQWIDADTSFALFAPTRIDALRTADDVTEANKAAKLANAANIAAKAAAAQIEAGLKQAEAKAAKLKVAESTLLGDLKAAEAELETKTKAHDQESELKAKVAGLKTDQSTLKAELNRYELAMKKASEGIEKARNYQPQEEKLVFFGNDRGVSFNSVTIYEDRAEIKGVLVNGQKHAVTLKV
jgi:chromosome segregation ATPase